MPPTVQHLKGLHTDRPAAPPPMPMGKRPTRMRPLVVERARNLCVQYVRDDEADGSAGLSSLHSDLERLRMTRDEVKALLRVLPIASEGSQVFSRIKRLEGEFFQLLKEK